MSESPKRRSVATETSRGSRSRYAQLEERKQRSQSSSLSPRIARRKLGYAPPSPLSVTVWYTSLDELYVDPTPAPPSSTPVQEPMFPRRNSPKLSPRNTPSPTHVKTKLHHFNPQEVAKELCIMDSELLRKIRPQELEGGNWMKEQKAQLAPNVLAMVKSSNKIAQIVPSEVLAETTPQAMAKVISIFIKVASKCYHLRNFNSLKAVLAGLQCTPVFRLKRSWKEMQAKRRKKYEALSKLMSEEHNWSRYRIEIQSKLDDNIPCIPFLGVLLTSIVQQGSAHSVKVGGRRYSGVEDYTIMEAITVRNRLEKMRNISGSNRYSTFNPDSIASPTRKSSQRNYSMSDKSDKLIMGRFDVSEPDHSILEEDGGSEEDESTTDSPETARFGLLGTGEKLVSEDSSSQQSPESGSGFDFVEEEREESRVYGNRCSQELGSSMLSEAFAANISSIGSLGLSSDSNTSEEGVALSEGCVVMQSLVASNHRSGDQSHGLSKRGGRPGNEDQVGCRGTNGLTLDTDSPVTGIGGRNGPTLERESPVGGIGGKNVGTESPVGEIGSRNGPTLSSESNVEVSDCPAPGTSRKAPPLSSKNRIPSVTVDCTDDHTEETSGSHFKVYWNSSPSPSPAVNVEPLEGPSSGGGATLWHPRFQRCVSEQQVALRPPKLGSFLSMECLTDLLQNPPSSPLLIRSSGSAQGLYKDSSLSLSSDEGLGLSDASSITTTPDLNTPTHFCGFSSGNSVAEERKSLDVSSNERASTGNASMTAHFPPASQPEAADDDDTLTRRPRLSQELTVDYSERKSSSDSITAEEPERRRSRRRASKVLHFALATSDVSMHVPSLLERYQVCSLACCSNLVSFRLLRELITNAPHNTEGQNYKLSYEREPQ